MESFDAMNMVEMTTEFALLTPLKIEWRLKNHCISEFWGPIDANPLS